MTNPKFSVVTVGKNESRTLPRLLASLAEFFKRGGEMVYVDTGSSDGTPDIARAAGCRVYEEGDRFRTTVDDDMARKINERFIVAGEEPIIKAGDSFFDFHKAKNYAMSLASNNFICNPDCDEAWTTLNIDRINELITEGYEKFLVEFVFAHNPDGTPSIAFAADAKFFDRSKVRWVGVIHETLWGETKMIRLAKSVAYLEHYQNLGADRTKYLIGLSWACYEEPDNDRNAHYFARELMYRGRFRSAVNEFERHINMDKWPDERVQSMIYMGDCHSLLGEPVKALDCWNRSITISGNRREPFIKLAQYWKYQNSPPRVAAYAAAALQIPDSGFYANKVANYTYEPHSLLYWAKGWMGDIPAARLHLMKCLDYHPTNEVFLNDMKYYFKPEEMAEARKIAGNDIHGWMTTSELRILQGLAKGAADFIEIGSWKGRSTKTILESCPGTVTAIDHFRGSDGEEAEHAEAKKGDIYDQFIRNVGHFPNLKVIKSSSVQAAADNPDLTADVIFIDGGHRYEDVVSDIKAWLPRAKKIICGHDYSNVWPEVKRAVDDTAGTVEVRESIWIKKL